MYFARIQPLSRRDDAPSAGGPQALHLSVYPHWHGHAIEMHAALGEYGSERAVRRGGPDAGLMRSPVVDLSWLEG
jgi:hypothetical protein